MLQKIKLSLRIKNTSFDIEVQSLIDAAKKDLTLSGVNEAKVVSTDPLILRAVTLYAKAHFGLGNDDSEKYVAAYESLKTHLSLSAEYTEG